MKDGICPKCGARDVHLYENAGAELAIRLGPFSGADVVYYICTNCGCVELFVKDAEKLPRIAAKYPKV